MQINVNYDSSVDDPSNPAPAGFKTAIGVVVGFLDRVFADPITLTIDVGWNEVNGQALTPNAFANNLNSGSDGFNYSAVLAALNADKTTATDNQASSSLPAGDPTNGGLFAIDSAQQKALGLSGPNAANSVDGYIGFSSSYTYTFDPYNRQIAGAYDFIGIALHEFTEILGRVADPARQFNGSTFYNLMDLYRFAGPDSRQLTTGDPSYFSLNDGHANLGDFNNPVTGNNGGLGDWAGENPYFPDAFNSNSNPGTINPVTARDIQLMDALGYDFVQPLLHFTGATNTDGWNDVVIAQPSGVVIGTNWTGNVIPTVNDDLIIDSLDNVVLTGTDHNGKPDAADSLTIASGASLTIKSKLILGNGATNNDVGLNNSGTITLDSSGSSAGLLYLTGTVLNTGTITLQSSNLTGNGSIDQSDIHIQSGDVTLRGAGSIVMAPGFAHQAITGWDATIATTLHNIDNKISGVGVIGGASFDGFKLLILDNHEAGSINATDASQPLILQPVSITNAGNLIATGAGGLQINNTTIVQTSAGIIGASGANAITTLKGVVVEGGTLLASNASDLQTAGVGIGNVFDGSTVGSLTNQGVVTIATQSDVTFKGEIVNKSLIRLLAANNTGNATLDQSTIYIGIGDVTLRGGGSIAMAGSFGRNEITGANSSSPTILHNIDNQISGFGFIGSKSFDSSPARLLTLDNQAAGVINGNLGAGNPLTLVNLSVTNAGILEATGSGGLSLTGAVIAQSAGGVIEAIGAGTHVDLNNVTINGGLLTTSSGGVIQVTANAAQLDGSTSAGAITNAGSLLLASGNTAEALQLKGTIHNSGTITLAAANNTGNASFDQADIYIVTTDVILDGGGTITFGGNFGRNEITGISTGAATTLHNVNNTISGFGTIGGNGFGVHSAFLLNFDNQAAGIVNANSGANAPLTLQNINAVNGGVLEATGSGGLAITSTTIAQTGAGVIEAIGAGTHVDLNNSVIQGGLLTTAGGGVIQLAPNNQPGSNHVLLDSTSSAGAVINGGSLLLASNDRVNALQLKGTLHNSGTITLSAANNTGNASFDQADIFVQPDDVTLDGGGSIAFAGTFGHNAITGASSSTATTLHNVDNTIFGFGAIGAKAFGGAPSNLLILDNQVSGTINANAAGALTLRELLVDNAGTIKATAAGGLAVVSATIAQTGAGIIQALGAGAHVDLTAATIQGGVITTGSGGVVNIFGNSVLLDSTATAGAVTNSGAIAVAGNNSTAEALQLKGTFHNAGTVTLTAANNTGNATIDQVNIAIQPGDVTLDGGGSIAFAGGWGHNAIVGVDTISATVLHNIDNTISGFGAIGPGAFSGALSGKLLFDNQSGGTVNANAAGALTLSNLLVNNAGAIETSGTGGLAITSATIAQTGGGVIKAAGSGSHIDLTGATLQGGLITTSSGGIVNVIGAANLIDGSTTSAGAVTNSAAFLVATAQSLQVKGIIHNSGTITLAAENRTGNASLDQADLFVQDGGVTLDGGGTIVLGGNWDHNAITGYSTVTATVLHNLDNLIGGFGTIGAGGFSAAPANLLILDNQAGGIIDANISGATLRLKTGATIANDGVLKADGGILVINDAVTGSGHGEVTKGGTILLNSDVQQGVIVSSGGSLVVNTGASVTGSTILGGGNATVSSGGMAVSTTLDNNASTVPVLTVLAGGTASATRIVQGTSASSPGSEIVFGTDVGAVISGGGGGAFSDADQTISSGGSAVSGVIYSGGVVVAAGGVVSNETVMGGVLNIFGTGSAVTIHGGNAAIQAGAVGSDFVVNGTTSTAADLAVASGGIVRGAVIGDLGTLQNEGGVTSNVTIHGSGGLSGGREIVGPPTGGLSGSGVDFNATVSAGGVLAIFGGGLASNTIVKSGGVLSFGGNGGTAFAPIISAGGYEQVGLLGTTVSTTIAGGLVELMSDGIASGGIDFASVGGGTLRIDGTVMPMVTISHLATGDSFDLPDIAFDSNGSATIIAGNVLRITENGQTYDLQLDQDYTGFKFLTAQDGGTGTSITEAVCFCRGTRILTDHGEMPVEELAVGDLVRTLSGVLKPIEWIGIGRDLVTRANKLARPVIVRQSALADRVPARDLYLTHGHALYLDDALIPVENLINHRTILWDDTARVVEYYHIELADHDILLAEGAAAESYYDAGNRALFHNTRPNSRAGADKPTYAPVLNGGDLVNRVWGRLFERAGGYIEQTTTADADPHLMMNGLRIDASMVEDCTYRFDLAAVPLGGVRLCSRSGVPSLLGVSAHDHRRLGIAIKQIELRSAGIVTVLGHEAAILREGGCYPPETGYSWTDGELELAASLFAHLTGPISLVLRTERPAMRYVGNVAEQHDRPAVSVIHNAAV